MRYCISDIHGEYELFCALLERIGFGEEDELIVLGDIIDKGFESVRLLRKIFSMKNAKVILGNHEYDFLNYYRALMRETEEDFDGVLEKLRERFPDGYLLDWDTVDRMERLPAYLEFDDFICVHAGIPLAENGGIVSPKEVKTAAFVYDRRFKEPDKIPVGSKCVIFGHTPTQCIGGNGRILIYTREGVEEVTDVTLAAKIHIDTGVSIDGVLGCLCVDTMRTFYVKPSWN